MNSKKSETSRKIAIFIPSLRGGGAERAMVIFAGGLVRAGHTVHLIAAKGDGPLKEVVHSGVHVFDLQKSRTAAALVDLVRYLRKERPDALYSTIPHTNIVAILARILARVDTKVVVRESNSPVTETKKSIARRIIHRLTPLLYPLADSVISVSEGVAAELRSMNPKLDRRISVLPSPVVSDDLLRQAEEQVDHPWFRNQEIPVVLAVGRLQPQKDFSTLLRAFAKVVAVRPARLMILGEGKERSALEALARELGIEDDIALPGFVINPFSYMKRARVFVLSSKFEGMPNVLLQAMAVGTPVVTTDCKSGPGEIVQNGKFGALVAVGGIDQMAAAILKSLDAPRRPDAAEYVKERFGVDRAVSEYLSVINFQASTR